MAKSQKGISPVIPIALLVLVVAALSYLIFQWAVSFSGEQQSKAKKVSEFASCAEGSFIVTGCQFEPGLLKIGVKSMGIKDLNGFTSQILYTNGERSSLINMQLLPAQASAQYYFFPDHNLPPEKIVIYPNGCPSLKITIHDCTYSNVAHNKLELHEGSVQDTNSVVLDSNVIALSQESLSKTFANSDFANGSFYYTEVGSVVLNGELDYAGSLPSSLRLYLKMNSISGNKVPDTIDYNNHGYIQGSVSLAPGLWNTNALNIDGNTNNYLEVMDANSLDLQDAITISVWIKPDNALQGTILNKGSAYKLYLENGYIVGEVNGNIVRAHLPVQQS